MIDGKRILTAAHVVRYATQVLVQPDQSGEKFPATVKAIAPDVDLAVLTLDDASFFDDHPRCPARRSCRSSATPCWPTAIPTGGETLSITRGIVSRVEFDATYYAAMAPAGPDRRGDQPRQLRRARPRPTASWSA